ncbi:dTDP-4-dehydrorhamnose 3,5-epimerase [Prochlorococcus marinus]|uniref:dTDP-4-dehydrorhamnose 3,5-epimerase n=1 Tax=Prochlorococcus marinus TaxID=1219 RepID=UPI001C596634|nr:dTDP-4-dehydrorhamnose 3,5-epimerase [Prochlorococcus marinus]MBW3042883.1 dTDP-4-dehydrorhamnose 3,5-epimerase [Prochlorococcus marinus str. XMU1408]
MNIHNLYSQDGIVIEGLKLFTPDVFEDSRGFFFESWNKKSFDRKIGLTSFNFVQDNHSKSKKGVFRGFHYQLPPNAQGKLVRCVFGEIFDIAIDIRSGSNSFGQWTGVNLSANNYQQLWIPKGFAHGFLTLSDHAEVIYKVTDYWNKDKERSISWKDPSIEIKWPIKGPYYISEKDLNAPFLSDLNKDDIF